MELPWAEVKFSWNLWVTKITSQEKVSSYMSVHMALTGLRAVLPLSLVTGYLSKQAHKWSLI